ncbi:MAG: alpha/beta fold hydrolase [Mangrovicoccus sp.]
MTWMKLALSLGLLIALLGLGYGIVISIAARKEHQAEQSYPPTGQILTIDGVPVHAKITGSGPDLVLLHGASGNIRDFEISLVPELAKYFRVILFDRPAHGWTENLPSFRHSTKGAPPREQAKLLIKAAKELGVQHPLVLGQSYGGTVALAWALEAPDFLRGLILVSAPSHPWSTALSPLYPINAGRVSGAVSVPLIAALANQNRAQPVIETIFAPQNPPSDYFQRMGVPLSLRRDSLRANARQVNTLLDRVTEMADDYNTIEVPTEILHGTADIIVPLKIHSEPLAQKLPNGHLTVLNGIGHMPHHSAKDQVIAAIQRANQRAELP